MRRCARSDSRRRTAGSQASVAASGPYRTHPDEESEGIAVAAAAQQQLWFLAQRPERRAAGISRLAAEILFDAQQLVIFRRTVGPRQRAGLDLPATGGDSEI